jgi:hypothetical protein
VVAAEQYASRLVVPQSERSHPSSWSSHKDHAAKALKKLAGSHLPGSLRQLETAIKRAHADATRTEHAAAEAHQAGSPGETVDHDSGEPAEDVIPAKAGVEHFDHEDVDEPAQG